jgi:hypothetical protein
VVASVTERVGAVLVASLVASVLDATVCAAIIVAVPMMATAVTAAKAKKATLYFGAVRIRIQAQCSIFVSVG